MAAPTQPTELDKIHWSIIDSKMLSTFYVSVCPDNESLSRHSAIGNAGMIYEVNSVHGTPFKRHESIKPFILKS
jgi:hypothetical protein